MNVYYTYIADSLSPWNASGGRIYTDFISIRFRASLLHKVYKLLNLSFSPHFLVQLFVALKLISTTLRVHHTEDSMSTSSTWVIYLIAGLYALAAIAALYGLYASRIKKKEYLDNGIYDKRRRAHEWRNRFLTFTTLAIMFRISSLVLSAVFGKPIRLRKPKSSKEFYYQFIAIIPSNLMFTSFSLIVWFFAHIVFMRRDRLRRNLTPFFVAINVALYFLKRFIFNQPILTLFLILVTILRHST